MSGGYVVNVGDFSGVHSGVVFGICNTVCKKIFDNFTETTKKKQFHFSVYRWI
jgi:hypothetical protein